MYVYETFIEDYPEFAGLPEAAVKRVIGQSVLMLAEKVWGKWFHMAQGLWTAHYLALAYDIAAACAELGMKSPTDMGAVTSLSASTSSLSISRSTSAMLTGDDPIAADFGRTAYGMQYLNILETVIPPVAVVYSADTSASAVR